MRPTSPSLTLAATRITSYAFLFAMVLGTAGCTGNDMGPSCAYGLSLASQSVPSAGTTVTVAVTRTTGGCAWSAVSNVDWISFTGQTGASDTGTLTIVVAPNTGAGSRTGVVSVQFDGQTLQVTVTEDGTGAPCAYGVTPTTQAVSQGGGTFTASVTVSGSGDCSWTATADASFITVTSGASGTASGTIVYSVSANTGTATRTGTITVRGSGAMPTTVTITQSATSPSCSYSVTPTTQAVPAAGGDFSAIVTVTGSSCSWTASADESFITVTAGFTGTASGTVEYTVAANPGPAARTGSVTVLATTGARQVAITQAGP